MYPFILSAILVVVISMCIYKKEFWENRYLVLLMIMAVSLVSMTTINYTLRGSLPHNVEVVESKPLLPLYTKNSTERLIPSIGEVSETPRTRGFVQIDSLEQTKSYIVQFTRNDKIRVGWSIDEEDNRINYGRLEDIYFAVCNDNPRYEERVLKYDASHSSWVISRTLPSAGRIRVLYLPEDVYNSIKSEYKPKMPF